MRLDEAKKRFEMKGGKVKGCNVGGRGQLKVPTRSGGHGLTLALKLFTVLTLIFGGWCSGWCGGLIARPAPSWWVPYHFYTQL